MIGYKEYITGKPPLLVVSDASGAGKTAVYQTLLGKLNEVVMLEGDLIWRPELDKPETKYRDFFETWLKICRDISQSGRPVVMFNAGMGVPENIEPCVGRRYFFKVHYLALVCEDDVLADRLRQRSERRDCSNPEYIRGQIEFNQWFKNEGPHIKPPVELIDTTGTTLEETAKQVTFWIRNRLDETKKTD
jgi:hypothetical protein